MSSEALSPLCDLSCLPVLFDVLVFDCSDHFRGVSSMRPTLEQTYLGLARVAARRSGCTRSENSQVGATLVTTDGIIFVGWNGTEEPGQPECFEGGCPRGKLSLSECPSGERLELCTYRHAESSAVGMALRALPEDRVVGSTVYVTREPCDRCQRMLSYFQLTAIYPTGRIDP